jgi:hypothetical protein
VRSRGWSWLAAAAVAAWLVLGIAGAAHADPAEARARATKVLADPAYQRELPGPTHGGTASPATSSGPAGARPQGARRRADDIEDVTSGGSAAASAVMWVVFGIGALLLVVLALRELGGFEPPVVAAGDEGAPSLDDAQTAAIVARPLDDAETLARAGRFGEAIHALLLRTLEELMRRLDRPLPRSRTSREILAETRLPEEARGALGHLVSAVEVSFFGGSEPGAEDYQLCVERFRRFAEAYTRGVRG